MADTRTRIINLPEATTLDPSMNFVEDSADGSGTRRVTYDTLKGAINQEVAVNLAPAYSNAATYNVGDLCTYQGTLYTCNTQISTAEDWTAAHWTLTNMASDLYQLKSNLSNLHEDITEGYVPNYANVLSDWKMDTATALDESTQILPPDDTPSKIIHISNTDGALHGASIDLGTLFKPKSLGTYHIHFKARCCRNSAYAYQTPTVNFYQYDNTNLKGSYTQAIKSPVADDAANEYVEYVKTIEVAASTSDFNTFRIYCQTKFDFWIKDIYIIKGDDNSYGYCRKLGELAAEDALESGKLVVPFTWESGAIGTSTGIDAVNSNYVRTSGFYKTHNGQTVYNGCDQTIQVFYYNLGYGYDHFENHSPGSTETLDADYPYYRIRTLATVDNVSLIVSSFDVLDGIIARADKQQNLTDVQKAQLRSNIGVSSSGRIATKKIAIIGDSLSDWDYAPTTKWMSYLRDIDGYTIDNQAVSGSGYLNGSLKGGTSDHYFYNQALRIANDCDMVVVFGSLNDISRLDNADATIGTVDDTAVSTLCGAFNTMINNILSINPSIIIMVVIPCPWNGRRPNMSSSDTSYQNVMDYTAMIKTLCEYNSIPCLDLFHESGLRPWLEAFRTTYYQNADGTHPNELGQYTFLYPQIRQFIKRLNNDDI